MTVAEVRGIILDTTSSLLEIDLAGAVTTTQLAVVACYRDWLSQIDQPQQASTQVTLTNDTTEATICDAPGDSNVSREVFYLHVSNRDTVAAVVTLRYQDATSQYAIIVKTLNPSQALIYGANFGWQII